MTEVWKKERERECVLHSGRERERTKDREIKKERKRKEKRGKECQTEIEWDIYTFILKKSKETLAIYEKDEWEREGIKKEKESKKRKE